MSTRLIVMETKVQVPMPAPEREAAPPDNVSVEKPKLSPIDRLANIGNEISKATQQGLSYANARRARDTYKPI